MRLEAFGGHLNNDNNLLATVRYKFEITTHLEQDAGQLAVQSGDGEKIFSSHYFNFGA